MSSPFQFTFHYASTLSKFVYRHTVDISNLHSTMLLLYRAEEQGQKYGTTHLHSTMLLLYPITFADKRPVIIIYIPLCFYFIERPEVGLKEKVSIYIPLCFYFIAYLQRCFLCRTSFTFHYASTLSNIWCRVTGRISLFTFHYASTLSLLLELDWQLKI